MRRMTGYIIHRDADLARLMTAVNDWLARGWEVLGPPYVSASLYHHQAMARYEEEK